MSKPKLAVIVDGNLAAAGPGDKDNIDGLGTAATRDVGESSSNVMEVGAFGLGGNMAIGSNTDPNPTGFYYNKANAQAHGSGAFFLDVKYSEGNYAAFRLSTDIYNNNIYWQRGLGGGNYGLGAPVKLLHTGNILSTTGQSTDYPMTQKAITDELDTKANTSSLGTAATRNVGTDTGNVMQVGAFGLGGTRHFVQAYPVATTQTGFSTFANSADINLPQYGMSVVFGARFTGDTAAHSNWLGQLYSDASHIPTLRFRTSINGDEWSTPVTLISNSNILTTTGQSTLYPMTQKAVTDAINDRGFADASGVLTVTGGALSNDMSSFLSQTTKAAMRSNLEVPQLNASATEQGGLKARLTGTTLYLTNNGTDP